MQQDHSDANESDAHEQALYEWSPTADRLAPLIDGVEYFAAVHAAIRGAQRQVFIIGWDLHSEVELLRGEDDKRAKEQDLGPTRLADLLESCVQANDQLHIRLVIWEANALFALERQHLPRMRRPWDQHPRINLVWATDAPSFASFHEKVVVIDDRLAFAGGMDLTKTRWDTHEHFVNDKRRRKPGLIPFYGDPYHDAMLVLDGEAAQILGDHCRERWHRATGETIDPPRLDQSSKDSADPWPEGVEPLLTDRRLRIARTLPQVPGQQAKRQVERSYVAQIKAAQRFIFIETQYLAAESIAQALCDRLNEQGGPELVMILPFGCPGRLQAMAMDSRRDALLARLREADPGGRLGVYWPTLAGGQTEDVFEHSVYVHAKTMVIDDHLLRIGSANLNNRSMGLDTELDLFVEVDEEAGRDAIRSYRLRLLSYLLDVGAEQLAEAERDNGSLVGAIESLRGGERTLHPFDHTAPQFVKAFPLDIELADPSQPLDDVDAQRVLDAIAEQTRLRDRLRNAANRMTGVVRRLAWLIGLIAAAGLLLALWYLTPLHTLVDQNRVTQLLTDLRGSPTGLLGMVAVFIVLGSFGFPITLLVAATGAIFQDWLALPVAMLGVMGSSVASFGLGRAAPGWLQDRIGRGRLKGIVRLLRGREMVSVAVLRNLPVAPYVVVNIAFGLSGVGWRDYLLGTLIGMLPGVALLSLFGTTFGALLADPSPTRIAMFAGALMVLAVGAWAAQRLRRRRARQQGPGREQREQTGEKA